MTSAEPTIQQSTETPSRRAGRSEQVSKPSKAYGLQYHEGYPKPIRKTIEPSLKEEVAILFDFSMPDDDNIRINNKEALKVMLDDLLNSGDKPKAPRYWFNTLVEKKGYESTLWLILNVKATLLNSANANLIKEWRLTDKVKIPSRDGQEVGAIASLYEKKIDNEKIIETNTKSIKAYIDEIEEQTEKRKEILYNIALGNVGGLYIEFARWENEESAKGAAS